MVYSISVAVDSPLRSAIALAEIWESRYLSLVPLPNSYLVLPTNDLGTAVEVHPKNTELCVSESEIAGDFFRSQFATEPMQIRGSIAVAASREAIEQIAAREQWQTQTCRFGLFEVVELWIDREFMLELLPESQGSLSFFAKAAAQASIKIPAEMLN